jgi:hypothetical protein
MIHHFQGQTDLILRVMQGRATIEMTLKKPEGRKFDVDGDIFEKLTLRMVRNYCKIRIYKMNKNVVFISWRIHKPTC